MQLEEITTDDIQAYLDHKKTIILPFGSTEQHGPHLPMGTDTLIAEAIAKEAGKRSHTMVAPVVPIGFSPGLHPHFAGTISFKAATYIRMVQEIFAALLDAGFEDVFVLTGHGLNYSPLKTAVLDLFNTYNGRALVMGYWEFAEVKPLIEPGDGVHCTILETSIMLYLNRELVNMTKAVDEYKIQRFLLGTDYMKQISASGVIAETTKATAEKGQRYFNAIIDGMLRVLQTFESPEFYD